MDAYKQELEVDDEDLEMLVRQGSAHEEVTPDEEEDYFEIRELLEFIKCHRPITSVIRRLPAEIIAEILLHTRPAWDQLEAYPIVHDTRRGPWSHSRVSYMWRTISLSLPQIWSDLTIDEVTSTKCRARLQVLKLWLERSGNKSLRIVGNIEGEAIIPEYEDMMKMLVAESHRWDIFLWNVGLVRRKCTPTEAYCLQAALATEVWDGPADQDIQRPNLRMYHLGGSGIDSDTFRLLRSAPNLEALSLNIRIRSRFPPRQNDGARQYPTFGTLLQELQLAQVFDVAPASHSCYHDNQLSINRRVPSSVAMSPGNIIYSAIPGAPLDAHLVQVLEAVPTLKELLLSWTHECTAGSSGVDSHTILEKLTVKKGRPLLLPSLATFSMDVYNDTDLTALFDMLESRCTEMEDRPLTRCHFHLRQSRHSRSSSNPYEGWSCRIEVPARAEGRSYPARGPL